MSDSLEYMEVTDHRDIVYKCVPSRMYESCHICMSNVTYEKVTSHIYAVCHTQMSL